MGGWGGGTDQCQLSLGLFIQDVLELKLLTGVGTGLGGVLRHVH